MFKRLALALGLATFAASAQSRGDALGDVMGGQGCAIGPETAMAPLLPNADLYPKLQAFAENALGKGQAERQGDWIVLGPEICTIRPPVFGSRFAFDDPIIQAGVDPYTSNKAFGEYGCFVDGERLQNNLVERHGLSADEATVAYLTAIADGVRKGQVSFFSDDMLVTPLGFQSLIGDCADVPKIDDIRRSQALLLKHFDTVVRDNAKRMRCEENRNAVGAEVARTLSEVSDGAAVNAWAMMDVMVLAIGAGWIDGVGATRRGTPRPPICSYGD